MVLATALHTNLKQKNVLSIDRASDFVFVWRGGITPKKGICCVGLQCFANETAVAGFAFRPFTGSKLHPSESRWLKLNKLLPFSENLAQPR